jgi:cbb3-type cytochrome oxidase subunit 3
MHLAATGGETALSIFVAVVLGGAFVLLGVVCWVFWRAAKQEPE